MTPKQNYRSFLIWLITALFVLYSYCLNMASAVLAEHIQSSLTISSIQMAGILGAYIIGFALMQIPAGYSLDRFNARIIVSSAILLSLIGNTILTHTQNYILFCAGNFLCGAGNSFAFISAGVLIAEWFRPSLFPILLGVTEALSTLLVAMLGYFFILEMDKHNWQDIYFTLNIWGFILFIFSILFIQNSAASYPRVTHSLIKSLNKVMDHKQIWLCSFGAAMSFGVLLAYADFWFVVVQKYYAVESKDTALIGSMFYLGIAVGPIVLGWVSNYFQSRKLILHFSLVLGNMVLLLALYLPHFPIETLIIIKIVSFFTGFLLSGSLLFFTVVKESVSNQIQGVALSFAYTVVFLVNSLMLFIPYLFLTRISTEFFTYLWILPFSVMIAILLNYFIKDTR